MKSEDQTMSKLIIMPKEEVDYNICGVLQVDCSIPQHSIKKCRRKQILFLRAPRMSERRVNMMGIRAKRVASEKAVQSWTKILARGCEKSLLMPSS